MTDKERIAELEEENERLKDAIEWECGFLSNLGYASQLDGLRARAFPPKFEDVDVKRWECPFCTMVYHTDPYTTIPQILLLNDCCNKSRGEGIFIILTGHYHRQIVAKVKRREEIGRPYQSENVYPKNARFFMEYDE